jgi:hypothetical protein
MSYGDLIKQLKSDKADPKKASTAMLILGALSILGSFWNLFVYLLLPHIKVPGKDDLSIGDEISEFISLELILVIFTVLVISGFVFLIASNGIRKMKPWGKKTGQIGIALFVGSFIILGGFGMITASPIKELIIEQPLIIVFFSFISLIFLAQFAIPAYYGIRYLGRLPVNDSDFIKEPVEYGNSSYDSSHDAQSAPEKKYRHSPFPFGAGVTFIFLFLPGFFIIMLTFTLAGPVYAPIGFIPLILIIFIAPMIYNNLASPFQKERVLIKSFTGGGSISLMNGSTPFFRMLIYGDGIEIRVMFNCYFIPYDKMDDIDEKAGFFSSGILIKSDLPDVPSRIRFNGSDKEIRKIINEQKRNYLSNNNID